MDETLERKSVMIILAITLSSLALASAQDCSCESSSSEFTDLRFTCPIDHFCSDSLVAGPCGHTCHAAGSFHSSPFDDEDEISIGNRSCAGSKFDFDNGGSVLCAYSSPSSVLYTMNRCNIPIFHCEDCNSSAVRYFDYDHSSFQILCDSGFLQFKTSDGHAYQYDYRIWMEKETCSLYGAGGLAITAVSCKVRPYEIDECLGQVGSPPGLTGHCRFGTCWLYCQDKSKQLSFETYIDGEGDRIRADFLACEGGFNQFGQVSAFDAECN